MADNPSKKVSDRRNRGKRNQSGELSDYVFGKVQPQARALEEAVLGAVMLDKDALAVVLDILRAESFYSEAHKLIYTAMLQLYTKSQPIDLLPVTEELRKSGDLETIGGPYYLVELTNRIASAANIEYHARIIAQKHIQRELIRVSTKIIKDAYEETTDVFDLLDDAEKGLFAITQQNLSRGVENMASITTKNVHRSNALMGHSYGEDFVYDEMMLTGPGDQGKAAAEAIASMDMMGGDDGPKPGEGPSKEEREAGFYDVMFHGTSADGQVIIAGVTGDKDPGYGSTSKMIAESAICLVKDDTGTPGGIWTPAPAMGGHIVKRLTEKAGLTFTVEN